MYISQPTTVRPRVQDSVAAQWDGHNSSVMRELLGTSLFTVRTRTDNPRLIFHTHTSTGKPTTTGVDIGTWIIRHHDGSITAMGPEKFHAHYSLLEQSR